ncbi:MAG: hypothetical protein JWN93_3203 [Hyphomicrobiales bacterium]|nr:hypothetical protein [Hyphomicrobiales bacterium]
MNLNGEARAQGAAHMSLSLFNPALMCNDDCYFSLYSGRYLKSEMTNAFGIQKFEPPNRWRYGDSGLIAATFARPLYAYGDLFRGEVELGVGKRFGALSAFEHWGALYFRWLWFPWNTVLRTSIAVSTGLNYTPTLDAIETARVNNGGRGARLLHFLSPEITFGLPQNKDINIFVRYHHRSGGRNYVMGKSEIFNDAAGGAQYLVFGIRYTH